MPTMTGYAHRTPVKRPEWHSLIAWDMFFNNITTGLFLVAAVCELAAPDTFHSTTRWAYPVALAVLMADLLCLVLDLGDPLRFHHMLRVIKPTSPMSLGTWCLTVYSLPLTVIVAMDLLMPGKLAWVRWLALAGGILPAFGSAVYKGVLISTSSQPGWKEARWLGGYLANSAVMIGCAGMSFIAVITGQAAANSKLRTALEVLILLNAIPTVLLAIDVQGALAGLFDRNERLGLAALTIAGGLLIPLGLLIVSGHAASNIISVVFLLATSLFIRFLLVKLPHSTP